MDDDDLFHDPLENDPVIIKELMTHFLTGEAGQLPSNIGHFMMWFGTAEMFLTRILAFALDINDMRKFELLVKGMDARVKCERFRKATKSHLPAGPILLKALSRFENKMIPLRNKISHSWPVLHEETVYFCHVGRGALDPNNIVRDGTEISFDTLFLEGLWLNLFTSRLSNAFTSALNGGPLEAVADDRHPLLADH